MTWQGKISCPQRGDVAAGAAVRCGATPLEALIVGHTAAHGAHCWLTDEQQSLLLVQRNGRNPHKRSVARARRNAAAKGFLRVERVLPFQRPTGAKYRCGAGTTNKAVDFRALQVKDPISRGELRRIHKRENVAERPKADSTPVGPRVFGGRLVAAGTPKPPPPQRVKDYKEEFERMAAPAVEAAERRELDWQQRADERMLARVPRRRPRPPPE